MTATALNSKNKWLEFPNAVSGCLILVSVCAFLAPFTDLDFSWQIRTGEQIWESGQLRTKDLFTYTIAGQPVHDFEWLYEVTLYLIWTTIGASGLKVLKVILIAAPLFIVARHLRQQAVPQHYVVITLLLAIFILIPVWNLRAYYCTTIGLLLATTWLHDHCTGRRPLTWCLPAVMLLWANLHPGVILGQALLASAIGWEWLNRRLKVSYPLSLTAARQLMFFGGAALLATFVSPDPFDRLLYPFRPELRHPIMNVFVEMQPAYSFIFQTPIIILLTYSIAALTAWTIIARFRQYRLWEITLMIVLTILANFAVRSLQDWLLVMLTLAVPHLRLPRTNIGPAARLPASRTRVACSAADTRFHSDDRTDWCFRLQPLWLAAAPIIILSSVLITPRSHSLFAADACTCPKSAADFIKENGLYGRYFGPPNYGSYLGWRFRSKVQVYVDTRGFFFPPHLLEDSHYLPQLTPNWRKRLERVLDEFHTEYFLLETTGPRGKLWQHLRKKNVTPLYLDEETVLLHANQVRRALLDQS